MDKVDIKELKKLRDETSASVTDCRNALIESEGDYKKALEWIKKRSLSKADKKADRETEQGLIEPYVHQGKVGVLVEVSCETDFVARTDEFKSLAHELAMQIASMAPESVEDLNKQAYIRDPKMTIEELVKSVIGKLGENIKIKRFNRMVLGE